MAKITKEEFISSLKEMKIEEILEWVQAMKEEFGIDPMAMAVASTSQSAGASDAEAKTEFNVTLSSFGQNKISVIKVVKELLGIGIAEAKTLVESAPKVIKENVKSAEAEEIKAQLVAAGAEVSID